MYGEATIRPQHTEMWLAVVSEVLAVLLSDNVTEAERDRCRKLLAAWSDATLHNLAHITMQVRSDRKDMLPLREALPALHALLDKSN